MICSHRRKHNWCSNWVTSSLVRRLQKEMRVANFPITVELTPRRESTHPSPHQASLCALNAGRGARAQFAQIPNPSTHTTSVTLHRISRAFRLARRILLQLIHYDLNRFLKLWVMAVDDIGRSLFDF